jgi:hypothetical protein
MWGGMEGEKKFGNAAKISLRHNMINCAVSLTKLSAFCKYSYLIILMQSIGGSKQRGLHKLKIKSFPIISLGIKQTIASCI